MKTSGVNMFRVDLGMNVKMPKEKEQPQPPIQRFPGDTMNEPDKPIPADQLARLAVEVLMAS